MDKENSIIERRKEKESRRESKEKDIRQKAKGFWGVKKRALKKWIKKIAL